MCPIAAGGGGTAKNGAEVARILDAIEQELEAMRARSRQDLRDRGTRQYANWGLHWCRLIEKRVAERYDGCLGPHRCDFGMIRSAMLDHEFDTVRTELLQIGLHEVHAIEDDPAFFASRTG